MNAAEWSAAPFITGIVASTNHARRTWLWTAREAEG
jgi:hypothetical protein